MDQEEKGVGVEQNNTVSLEEAWMWSLVVQVADPCTEHTDLRLSQARGSRDIGGRVRVATLLCHQAQ